MVQSGGMGKDSVLIKRIMKYVVIHLHKPLATQRRVEGGERVDEDEARGLAWWLSDSPEISARCSHFSCFFFLSVPFPLVGDAPAILRTVEICLLWLACPPPAPEWADSLMAHGSWVRKSRWMQRGLVCMAVVEMD